MILLAKPQNLNGGQLVNELRAAGFQIPEGGLTVVEGEVRLQGVQEEQRAAVEAVVAAHVPQPDSEREEVKASVIRLRALKAKGWSNLTAADRNEVLQHLAVVILYLRRGD